MTKSGAIVVSMDFISIDEGYATIETTSLSVQRHDPLENASKEFDKMDSAFVPFLSILRPSMTVRTSMTTRFCS
jgi:hypothetical protein